MFIHMDLKLEFLKSPLLSKRYLKMNYDRHSEFLSVSSKYVFLYTREIAHRYWMEYMSCMHEVPTMIPALNDPPYHWHYGQYS